MVSITSKTGIKAFFRNEDEVVVQKGGMEVVIKVGANMEIKCPGTLTIEAESIDIKSNGNTSIKALNLALKGEDNAKLTSAASTEVVSSGITAIRGTLVKLN